jgi:hypothetical protein
MTPLPSRPFEGHAPYSKLERVRSPKVLLRIAQQRGGSAAVQVTVSSKELGCPSNSSHLSCEAPPQGAACVQTTWRRYGCPTATTAHVTAALAMPFLLALRSSRW